MYFQQIATPGLGCLSYAVGCPAAKVMAVVDPRRDVQVYLDIAREEGMRITHVVDTHLHADHVSGAHELASRTGAEILMGEGSPVSFAFRPLRHGDVLTFGAARLTVLSTPGHTPHAISLLLTDTARSEEPWMLLSGDLLFVGDVGRPDLAGGELLEEQVRNLWRSLRETLGNCPDHLEVFPSHGMGSLCGRGLSSKPSTTLGFERLGNPMLRHETLESFREALLANLPVRPKSFTHIIATNAKGAPLLDRCPVDRAMSPDQFEAYMKSGTVVIDCRDAAAFGGMHIPGSLNIGLERQLANWVGMVVAPESDILLVTPDDAAYETMTTELHRIGYDNIYGYLSGSIGSWVYSGRPVDTLALTPAQRLKARLDADGAPLVLDVRTPAEWGQGVIPGARRAPLSDLLEGRLPHPEGEAVIYCASGYRSNIAASFLRRTGAADVSVLAGGMLAWTRAGFPVESWGT
jgi:glyoxylase-like metal-dependent hydrolase (beta-lactamase superfamily II)/rhodanese-related sulfurtransferase